jgi:hypothetical protein
MNRSIEGGETSFINVLIKLIPSEVIAVFVFIQGVMPYRLGPHVVAAAILLAITPIYLTRVMGVRSRAQLVISTLSLVIWMYAMRGGPVQFLSPPFYERWYGAVALAIWTLVPPMFLTKTGIEHEGPEAGKAVASTTRSSASRASSPGTEPAVRARAKKKRRR